MKTYYVTWEEYDGEYWHEGDAELQAHDIQQAISIVAANEFFGKEIVEIRNFSVREKEVQNAR